MPPDNPGHPHAEQDEAGGDPARAERDAPHRRRTLIAAGTVAVATAMSLLGFVVDDWVTPLPSGWWLLPMSAVTAWVWLIASRSGDRQRADNIATREHVTAENVATREHVSAEVDRLRDHFDEMRRVHRQWMATKLPETVSEAVNGNRPPAPVLDLVHRDDRRG